MTGPATGRGDGEGLSGPAKAQRKRPMKMLTLREFYEPTEKMPAEIDPDIQKKIKDIDISTLHEINRLVAIMTEAHLTCANKVCRSTKMCCGNTPGPHDRPCRAPMTHQRADMALAIVTFLSLAGTNATLRDMKEEKAAADSAAAQELARANQYR
jgi:hypothetical protein